MSGASNAMFYSKFSKKIFEYSYHMVELHIFEILKNTESQES